MSNTKNITNKNKIASLSDYFTLYNKLENEVKKNQFKDKKFIKIAILSSFTIKGIKEILFVKCFELGVLAQIYVSNYNQYTQDILNSDSELYNFKPHLIILFIDAIHILGKQYLAPYQISDIERKEWVEKKLNGLKSLIAKIKENSSAKVLIHNLEVPFFSSLGIAENKQKFGFVESIEDINWRLRDAFKNDAQVFVFDYNAFCSRIGKQNIMDYKMYYLGDIKLDLQNMPELGSEYIAYIKPLMSLSRKCIVIDLDNTLWGGIIGEDGLEGIKLGPTPEGKPFFEFQKYLLSLFSRGIILAINSKNNLDDVLEVFRKHPYMVLKEENFAAMEINWNDKISNMKSIADEINIGIDSLVFIDDDKLNQELIRKAMPEVLVVDLPEDPSLYLKTLMELNDFNTLQIIEEDKKRGHMYVQQRRRKDFESSVTDVTEYLQGLEMVATIEKANSFNIPRISQLTQKTNQFNMTTKRYPEETIKKFANDNNFIVVSVKVEDKFGDNGITGAAILEKNSDDWRIDTFLLSCRVIGRKIEESLLAYILKEAKKEKAKTVVGEFIPTNKNAPARDFYKNSGFRIMGKHENKEIWAYDTAKEYHSPQFIKVITK